MGFLLARNAFAWRNLALGGAVLVALAACEKGVGGEGIFKVKPQPASGISPALSLIGRDIEAPEAFQVEDSGLWDGRPSLGGVWVAHPDVSDPARVIIRNTANSNSVIGALFRRERATPGPALQVSSDAAVALGMLAGAPAPLIVTALRREEAVVSDPDQDIETLAPETIETSSLEPEASPVAATYFAPAPSPATDTTERAALLQKITSAGFEDAHAAND